MQKPGAQQLGTIFCAVKRCGRVLSFCTDFFPSFLTDFLFLEQNELSKNFGEPLDKVRQLAQDSFGFSFSKLFVYDVS